MIFHREPVPHRCLVACLIVALLPAAFSWDAAFAQAQPTQIDLAAQPLGQALAALAKQTGIEILAPAELLAGKQAPAVSGHLTRRSALAQLLKGSGLEARSKGDNSFIVQRAVPNPTSEPQSQQQDPPIILPQVTVRDSAEEGYTTSVTATGTRTDTPITEIPQSIQVIPRQVIEDQASPRLRDVYQNVSGVVPAPTVGNVGTLENPIIRGFEVFNTYRNGFRLNGQAPTSLVNVEQIDILKGPGGVMYGLQEPGGILNIVTKRPLKTPYFQIEQFFGSFNAYETEFDGTGPITSNGNLAWRLSGSYRDARSFQDYREDRRILVAPALLWTPSDRTSLFLEFSYSNEKFMFDDGMALSPSGRRVTSISRFLGQPDLFSRRDEWFVGLEVTHKITDWWTVRNQSMFHDNQLRLNAVRVADFETQIDGGGNLFVNRFWDGTKPRNRQFSTTLDSLFQFDTVFLKQKLLVGVDLSYEPRNGNSQDGPLQNNGVPEIFIRNPIYNFTPTPDAFTSFKSERQLYGFFLQDQLSLLDGRLHLVAGGRYDHIDQWTSFEDTPADRNDGAFTFRGGVLYKALPWLHPFASYSQGFNVPGAFTTGSVEPETSEQYEVGLKMPFFDEALVASFALYHLTKDNVVTDLDGDGFAENSGKLRSRGVEFDLLGRLTPQLSLIATYAYTDTKVLKSDFLPVGARFRNVPPHAGSLWLRYNLAPDSLLRGLSFGTGVYVRDRVPGNNADTFKLPSYARWDAFLRYRKSVGEGRKAFTAQINVQNILDKTHFESSFGTAAVSPGIPLSVIGSLRFEF
jgi:iron complex outermembrane recepter protein